MISLARFIVVLFGVFIVFVGLLMLLSPKTARTILQKAGSTNFINYAEITLRLIVAIALISYSDLSKFPQAFKLLGWFMLVTSLILYFVPRKLQHSFSIKSAAILKPTYLRFISPFAFLFGGLIIYNVI